MSERDPRNHEQKGKAQEMKAVDAKVTTLQIPVFVADKTETMEIRISYGELIPEVEEKKRKSATLIDIKALDNIQGP